MFLGKNIGRAGNRWNCIPLLLFVLLALNAFPALADDCSDFPGGVLDGATGAIAPSQIFVDTNCTIRNFPASNPLSTNFSFSTQPGQTDERWLIVFDNVVHTGQMACNAVAGHHIWFTNGSSTSIQEGCQNLLIPVEKIVKENPAGQTTAAIGVPFTYTLTMPVLFDPGTGTVINTAGSVNDLHSVTLTDDLNATGVDLTYVSHVAYWEGTTTPVPHTFDNVGGVLTFDNFPVVLAGQQIVLEITVVLEDTPANVLGTQFVNTAKWDFGRLIDGTFYEPLPGEWGISPPLTIGAPELVMTKTGPTTLGRTLNLGEWGLFGLDVQNTGQFAAWNVTLLDRLPDGATGGMCAMTPELLSARVFAADGATAVPGKGPLVAGTDYTLSYNAASCELTMTLLTPAGTIAPTERLRVAYRTQLDVGSQNGITLTNVAGAVEWSNGDSSNVDRATFTRTLTNGTPGTLDHEDAHTVTVALYGFFFEKTVANVTTGVSPATTAAPGDRLRYTLRLQSTDVPLTGLTFRDDLGALATMFAPGTLTLVSGTLPPGADASNTDPNGGTNGAGLLDIRNLSLPAFSDLSIQFEITLAAAIPNGTIVTNQAGLSNDVDLAVSDDPTVNGQADPNVAGDEDPTRVQIVSLPLFDINKTSTDLSGDPNLLLPGETLRYTITVKNVGTDDATDAMLRDQIPANTTYVAGSTRLNGAVVPDGAGGVAPLSNGIQLYAPENPTPGAMRADASATSSNVATIVFDVLVDVSAVPGTVVSNQGFVSAIADAIVDQPSDDPDTATVDDPTVDVVGAAPLFDINKTSADVSGDPNLLLPGETLRYTITVKNVGTGDATDAMLRDQIPANTTYVAGSTRLNGTVVPDGAGGVAPLSNGIQLYAPENPTPGAMRADASATTSNVATIVFDVLVDVSAVPGTVISNQGFVSAVADNIVDRPSDDPDTPAVDDPTLDVVGAAPLFDVNKTSADMSGDPSLLLPGETLRYTITVKNVGTGDATDAMLRDQIPANTTYVAGSTRLNGTLVPDGAGGLAPLSNGIALYAPENPTPGALRADASATTSNVATIVFDVLVNVNVIYGTVISNQGFVSAIADAIVDQPSDDPDTAIVDDPTLDVVGTVPLLFAQKSVVIAVDGGTANVVDPGDVLRYTIQVYNNGTLDLTDVTLRDAVPANTTYVADSTTLNGLPVGQPDSGVAPLVAGIPVSSSDLTPPLPGAGEGTLTAGESAIVEFDLRVNDGVPTGTLISNQATVTSAELPDQPTDGDGNPATGPEPTVVVVGDAQQLRITKQVAVVGGGPAVAGATLEYVVRVDNVATVPASYVSITDDLSMPNPGYLTYVDQSATLNGLAAGVTVVGPVITADYYAVYGPLAPNASIVLRFRAVLNANLAIGTRVTNTGTVFWNQTQQASASVSIDVGGVVGVGTLYGTAWHDANFDNVLDANERLLEGWTVELLRNGQRAHAALTAADGTYQIGGVVPNYATTDTYELVFSAPGAGPNTALLGRAYSPTFTNGLQRISDIIVASGNVLRNLDLPIDPNGVVYDSVGRTPIAGAVLTLESAGVAVPSICLDDPAQQDQVTLSGGFYKFDLNFADPACPSGGSYAIRVTAPSAAYVAGYSTTIPPTSDATTVPFSVPTCPGSVDDAIGATLEYCEAQGSELQPSAAVPAGLGTNYHVHLLLDASQVPGSSQIFNNHIPLDPDLSGVVGITKTTQLFNVARGQMVPYTITVNSTYGATLPNLAIVDRFPAGFRYVEGSARLDGMAMEPTTVGRELIWSGVDLAASGEHTLQLLLAVGAGVSEGEYVNRAQVMSGLTGNAVSGEASATVRLVPDPTFDCTDVMGKVFDDVNRNGVQDDGEAGLAGIRLVTARGLIARTDEFGRYHINCAITPVEGRGSNFVLKLDDRTLPTGFRASTEPVQIERATRGKTLRMNFGASIHRVVGLDIADAVFEPGTVEMRNQWKPRLELLLTELKKGPAVLRLSYVADLEDPDLVDKRLAAVKRQIEEDWMKLDCCYRLEVEPDVFWRLGGPPERAATPSARR